MANEFKEPGQLVLSTFDDIIDRIKTTRPLKSNGETLTSGFVYSQLVQGMPVAPQDYMNAYSPMGGVPFSDAVAAANAAGNQPGADAAAVTEARRSMEAAFRTSRLVDTMIMVNADDWYHAYPQARRISLNYESIIQGMQPGEETPIAPAVQARIDKATKVLYELDAEGNIIGKSKLYESYRRNATTYAQARREYAESQARLLNDPATRGATPILMTEAQAKVEMALDDLKAEGGARVEEALDVLGAVGISIQAHMTARAREIFEQYELALAGVADPTLYSYISPSTWADPESSSDGWTRLTVESKTYKARSETHAASSAVGQFESHYKKTQGEGGFSIFGFGAHGGGGSENSSWSNSYQSRDGTRYQFQNDSKNLSIDLEYALCTIHRPWFIGDLFYLRNWYLVGTKKHAVSDGTIEGQVNNESPLLPMVPVQFLAVRNVKISAKATDWGADGETLTRMDADASSKGSSWTAGGGGGFNIGFFSIGGGGSTTEGSSQSAFHNSKSRDAVSNVGWSFNGETLEIKGTQIIAWLSEIVPASAPMDDPTLP